MIFASEQGSGEQLWLLQLSVGVCCDWPTFLSRFPVALAVDENPGDNHGDDQQHQAHGDQDDDGIQTLLLWRRCGGIFRCGKQKTEGSDVPLRPCSIPFNPLVGSVPDPASGSTTEVSSTGRQTEEEFSTECVRVCVFVCERWWWGGGGSVPWVSSSVMGGSIAGVVSGSSGRGSEKVSLYWQCHLKNRKNANAKATKRNSEWGQILSALSSALSSQNPKPGRCFSGVWLTELTESNLK